MIAELIQAQKETDRQMQETDRRMQETDRRMQETDRRMQETDRQMHETDRRMKETGLKMEETDRRINKLIGQTGYDIGRMVEAMVEPGCLKLFRERGIDVSVTMRRLKSAVPGREMEVDILMVDGNELVAVEVKSTMNGGDVNRWVKKLGQLRQSFPQFKNHTVYGAVAALEYGGQANRFAHKKGLFVIRWADDLIDIANPVGFKAKVF